MITHEKLERQQREREAMRQAVAAYTVADNEMSAGQGGRRCAHRHKANRKRHKFGIRKILRSAAGEAFR